ncbi:hypothetical protein ACWD9K_29400 [Streptomyces sp. 900116325]
MPPRPHVSPGDHGLEAGSAVDDWRVLAARGRIADSVLICTLDRDHLEPVLGVRRARLPAGTRDSGISSTPMIRARPGDRWSAPFLPGSLPVL